MKTSKFNSTHYPTFLFYVNPPMDALQCSSIIDTTKKKAVQSLSLMHHNMINLSQYLSFPSTYTYTYISIIRHSRWSSCCRSGPFTTRIWETPRGMTSNDRWYRIGYQWNMSINEMMRKYFRIKNCRSYRGLLILTFLSKGKCQQDRSKPWKSVSGEVQHLNTTNKNLIPCLLYMY